MAEAHSMPGGSVPPVGAVAAGAATGTLLGALAGALAGAQTGTVFGAIFGALLGALYVLNATGIEDGSRVADPPAAE